MQQDNLPIDYCISLGPGDVNIYEFEMPSTVDIFDGLLKYHPLLSSVFFLVLLEL